jgi:predicted double-glycine peptidase
MRVATLIALSALLAAPVAITDLPAAKADGIETGAAGSFRLPVTSMRERPFQSVILQQYDFSCGAAALAMLLSHHYGVASTEEEVFTSMYENGDQPVIQKNGFSFLDMKSYIERIGMKADGFELTLDEIQKLGVPTIALIDTKGYMHFMHFVVIKGIKDKRVLLGDPAAGMMSMDRDEFEKARVPVVLLVRSKATVGRKHFNQTAEWGVKPDAPVGKGMGGVNSTIFVDQFGNNF